MNSFNNLEILEKYTELLRDHKSLEAPEVKKFFEDHYQKSALLFVIMRLMNTLYEKEKDFI